MDHILNFYIAMKRSEIILYVLLNIVPFISGAQIRVSKPPIDTSALNRFEKLSAPNISADGRFVAYYISSPVSRTLSLIITDTAGIQKYSFPDASPAQFTPDSRQIYFGRRDSLIFLNLLSGEQHALGARSFQPSGPNGQWLAYESKSPPHELTLLNLAGDGRQSFGPVSGYEFDPSHEALWVTSPSANDSTRLQLTRLALASRERLTIWTGEPGEWLTNFLFSPDGHHLAFLAHQKADSGHRPSLWYWRQGRSGAQPRLRPQDSPNEMPIAALSEMSFDGKWLSLSFRPPAVETLPAPRPDVIPFDIWSYKDSLLMPEQLSRRNVPDDSRTALLATEGASVQLLPVGTKLAMSLGEEVNDHIVIYEPDISRPSLPRGSRKYPTAFSIMTLGPYRRLPLLPSVSELGYFTFSPDGRWLVYFDLDQGVYRSFEFSSGRTRTISHPFLIPETRGDYAMSTYFQPAAPSPGWSNDGRVLLYDHYDLWAVDPGGVKGPTNLTASYSRHDRLQFRLLPGQKSFIHISDTLLFYVVDPTSQHNGFARLVLGVSKRPQLLTLGPYTYYRDFVQVPPYTDNGLVPLKAARAGCWVVERQSATEAPNIFITNDLSRFRPLSNLAPQAGCNWLSAEIVHWMQPDGSPGQGILYKPENFDSTQKYPMLISYYQQSSDRCWEFPYPDWCRGTVDVAWFVSHGYLVFLPDVHYKVAALSGKTYKEYACDAVVSGARSLARRPHVDAQHMGITGVSFGGSETNYIIAHSNLFAAAVSVAGVSDEFSNYLQLLPARTDKPILYNIDLQNLTEVGVGRMGATPWQRPDLYRKASPAWDADKVTTPVLIIANKLDRQVPWQQGLELFLALRRLDKRAWLLQYDRGGHGLGGPEARDFTIRVMQFFDYFLREMPSPRWLTQGIPSRLKGVDDGLAPDSSGRKP